jgi:PST family polysaccharide transporter
MRDELNAHRRPAAPGHPDTLTPFELKQSALGGFMWLSVGNGFRAVVKVGVLAILARLLAPEDFGLVAAAGVVIWFSMIFSNLGVGPALVQRRTLTAVHVETAFTSSVGFGIAMFGLIFLAAPLVAQFFRMPELTSVVRVMSIAFPIAGLAAVAECLLQRSLRFDVIARVELASYIVGYALVGVGLAWAGLGVWALVSAELAKSIVKTILFLRAAPPPGQLHFDRAAFVDLLRFGSGYTASGFSLWLVYLADTFVVGRFLGAAALGVYSRAYELMLVPGHALGVLLDKILFPTLSRVQSEPVHLRVAYRRASALVAIAVLPVSVATIVLAPEIVQTLLGRGWEEAIAPLQILALGMYLRVGSIVGQSVANSTGAVNETAWRNAVQAALVFTGAIVGQHWGLRGVATGVVVAMFINLIMVFELGSRITQTGWKDLAGVHLRAGLFSLLLGAEAWLVREGLSAAVPSGVTLLAAASLMFATALAIARFVPVFLGTDGLWIIETLRRAVLAPFRAVLRKTPLG